MRRFLNNKGSAVRITPSGFRARLAARFKIGDANISAVLGNVPDPADAYMVFRLGEMSNHPPEKVLDIYKANGRKGWGVMARQLGIKPGSQAFQALKKGHDFGGEYGGSKRTSKNREKNKIKSKIVTGTSTRTRAGEENMTVLRGRSRDYDNSF